MLDLTGIVISSLMMLFVILRAVQLDVQLPWFGVPKTAPDASGLRLGEKQGNTEGDPLPPPVKESADPRARGRPGRHKAAGAYRRK